MSLGDPPALRAGFAAGKPAGAGDFLLERRRRLIWPHLPERASLLLDVGCGNGAQTALLASRFDFVVGADPDPAYLGEMATLASRLAPGARVAPVRCAGGALPVLDGACDVVTCFEVLEHVDDDAEVLRELRRALRPGGRLVVSVPNRWWIFETHGANLPLLPWNRVPFLSWLPRALHDRWARARIYRRRQIVALLRSCGFVIEHTAYVTAPMDVVNSPRLRAFLRGTLFRADSTAVPPLAVSVLVVARKPA